MLRTWEAGTVVEDPLGLYMADNRDNAGRPWVLINMISSIDGATAVDGKSTGLGDEDDRTVFKALRTVADVILVGAGTVRAENYGPALLDEERRARRVASGMEALPRLAVVSGRLSVDRDARIFSEDGARPLVISKVGADAERVQALSEVAEVVLLEELDMKSVVAHLGGSSVILCEGGPSINGQLVASGLVDELNLTVSPLLAAGSSNRIAVGDSPEPPLSMSLDRALIGESSLFLRYLRDQNR